MNERETRPVHILIVEDNPGDVRLICKALEATAHPMQTAVVKDGVEALDYLYIRGAQSEAKRPDLVLLDLNLPRKNGREVLAEIKSEPTLQNIPIIVFSSSSAPADVASAYRLHANCYVTKPGDLDELYHSISWIEKYWLQIARLPSECAPHT